MMNREHKLMDRKSYSASSKFDLEHFSEFSNREKHKGLIPSERHLLHAYKKHYYSIRNYLHKEMKKRSVERLS